MKSTIQSLFLSALKNVIYPPTLKVLKSAFVINIPAIVIEKLIGPYIVITV